jgi:hypothetical protein
MAQPCVVSTVYLSHVKTGEITAFSLAQEQKQPTHSLLALTLYAANTCAAVKDSSGKVGETIRSLP